MNTLALIPARAGSKGIPGKNTRSFRGIPLVLRAVDVALDVCDRTVVTTDDERAAEMARPLGVVVVNRPPELAADDTPMLPVIQHALALMRDDSDVIVLLQPTSPLRTRGHVRAALRLLEPGVDSVVSVTPIPAHLSPDWAVTTDGLRLYPSDWAISSLDDVATRRQDVEPAYYRDGTVYVIRREVIEAGRLYGDCCRPLVIPAHESATIDTEADWALAEAKHG